MNVDHLNPQDQSEAVCQQIKQSLLDIFRDQYSSAIDVEVDAIICLREVNSNHNDVIKIHQILSKHDLKHFKQPGNNFNSPKPSNQFNTGRASSFTRMNGLQIRKRKLKENLHWKPKLAPKYSRLVTGNTYKSPVPTITGVYKNNIDAEYNNVTAFSLSERTKHEDTPEDQVKPSGNKVIIDLSAAPSTMVDNDQDSLSQYEDDQPDSGDLHPVAVFSNSGTLESFDLGENETSFSTSESKQLGDISSPDCTDSKDKSATDLEEAENTQNNSLSPTPIDRNIKLEPVDYDVEGAVSLFKETRGGESFSYTDNFTTFDVSSLSANQGNSTQIDSKFGVKGTHRSRKSSKPEKLSSNSHFTSQPVFPSLPLSTSTLSGDNSTDLLSSDTNSQISSFPGSTNSNELKPYTSNSLDSSSDMFLSKLENEAMFSCEKCGKMFTTKTTKIRHERFTCGKNMSECSICGKFFSRLDSLQRHQSKLHGIQSQTSRNQQAAVVWSQPFHQEQNVHV